MHLPFLSELYCFDTYREKNRQHARRSRANKKEALENLQNQVADLRDEVRRLSQIIYDRLPEEAEALLRGFH